MITDEQILEQAHYLGLDPWEVQWEVVPAHVLYDVAARGLPGRYSHWLFGRDYWRMKAGYDLGLSRIYEMVLLTRPALALLLEGNSEAAHILVKAHVLAHVDFFHHNRYSRQSNLQAHEDSSVRAQRIRTYESEHGVEAVETLLTMALALSQHSEPDGWKGWEEPIRYRDPINEFHDLLHLDKPKDTETSQQRSGAGASVARLMYSASEEAGELRGERWTRPSSRTERVLRPTRDILDYLYRDWPNLHDWERDVLSIVREDALYSWPIRQTKVINEGWATFWHQQILRALPLSDRLAAEIAALHAGVTAPSLNHINPYHLGLAVWRSIEKRHGRERMFEIRRECGDQAFLRNFLDERVIVDEGLYLWEISDDLVRVSETQWEKVRDGLCNMLADPHPDICVVDAEPGRWLQLHHNYSGRELHREDTDKLLLSLAQFLAAPVVLTTVRDGDVCHLLADPTSTSIEVRAERTFEGGTMRWPRT